MIQLSPSICCREPYLSRVHHGDIFAQKSDVYISSTWFCHEIHSASPSQVRKRIASHGRHPIMNSSGCGTTTYQSNHPRARILARTRSRLARRPELWSTVHDSVSSMYFACASQRNGVFVIRRSRTANRYRQCGERRNGHTTAKAITSDYESPSAGIPCYRSSSGTKKNPGNGGVEERPHVTNDTSTRPYLKTNPSYSLWTPMVRHRAAVCGTYTSHS
jgi:hypothetical protein